MAKAQLHSQIKYLIFGFFCGIFLSGILAIIITFNQNKQSAFINLSQTVKNTDALTCLNETQEIISTIKININTASVEELDSLPGIGEVKANNIVFFRQKYGEFKEIEELLYVPGISNGIFQQLCAMITVNK